MNKNILEIIREAQKNKRAKLPEAEIYYLMTCLRRDFDTAPRSQLENSAQRALKDHKLLEKGFPGSVKKMMENSPSWKVA